MVVSILDPKLNYRENKSIHIDDVSQEVSIYEIPLYGQFYDIGLGSVKYDYNDSNNILHIPVYLVVNGRVIEQIGLYEVEGNSISSYLDEEGDIDLVKMKKPLLFSYVKKDYLNRIKTNLSGVVLSSSDSKSSCNEQSGDSVDTMVDVSLDLIPEQTTEQSKNERSSYKKEKDELWIRSFLKNAHIDEMDNEGGGHCLFAVIRDAYASSGIDMSIKELREKLSDYANQEQYQYYRGQYEMYRDAVKELTAKMKTLNKQNEDLRKKLKSVSSREEQLKYAFRTQTIEDTN